MSGRAAASTKSEGVRPGARSRAGARFGGGRRAGVRALVLALCFAVVAVAACPTTARAGDRDFSLVVDHIKREYHTKPRGGFAAKLAGLAVKFARPAGVKSLKLAVFEDLDARAVREAGSMRPILDKLGADWQPVVRVSSKRDGEQTYVYARPAKKDMEFLVITVDATDAAVVKVKVSPEATAKWLRDTTEPRLRARLTR